MIFTTIDFERKGKQHGYLQLPYSHNLGVYATGFLFFETGTELGLMAAGARQILAPFGKLAAQSRTTAI